MKTISKAWLLLVLAGTLFLGSCAGGYYVVAQPVEPVYERPAPPYQGAVWIDGEWTWNGGLLGTPTPGPCLGSRIMGTRWQRLPLAQRPLELMVESIVKDHRP
jgi:hypothetical protein